MDNIINLLKENIGEENVKLNEEMSKHTTFKTGGPADIFLKVTNQEDLKFVLEISKKYNIPIFILGNGSNILVRDKGIRGIVCEIKINKFEVEENDEDVFVLVGSGNKNAIIAQKLLNLEIEGFEFASGIPGTLGGAIKMNAGAYGKEMKDIVFSTTYMDYDCNVCNINLESHKFGYRNSIFSDKKHIILESKLKLKKGKKSEIEGKMKEYQNLRKEKQPICKPSAGSTFKRGEDFLTSKLIDECGLKGKQIGGAKVSEKHAGFIINEKSATSKDILDLIEYMQKVVYDKSGKKIELEIEIVGEE